MKLIVSLTLILFAVFVHAQEVEADPRGERCVVFRHGTCHVDSDIKQGITLKLSGNDLILKVYRDKYTSDEEVIMFAKNFASQGEDVFRLETPFSLTKDLRQSLKLDNETTIPAGEYPVTLTREIIEIKFKVEFK